MKPAGHRGTKENLRFGFHLSRDLLLDIDMLFVSETGYGPRDGTGYAPVIDAAIFASPTEEERRRWRAHE